MQKTQKDLNSEHPSTHPYKSKTLNAKSNLSPELLFLIACCKTERSEDDINFILSYLNAERLTLNALIAPANQHGILPLVYKTLKNLSQKDDLRSSLNPQPLVLSTILSELKTHYMSIAQKNIMMSAELLRIMKLLRENHIEALAFKGPALAQMAYGDITLRQYSDLDILVDENDVYKAGELLQKNGFTSPYPLSILENETCMRVDSDFSFTGNANNILIEMHWRLFRKNIGHHLTFEEFSHDRQSIKINGVPITVLSPELHLVYLAVHGSKHAWERIEWIVDLDKFIRNLELNDQKLKEAFDLMQADRAILIGFYLSQRLFQTPVPEWIKKEIESDQEIEKLYDSTIEFLNRGFYTMTQKEKSRAIYLYQQRFFKTSFEKAKYFFATYLSISPNDCLQFPLPDILRFLYIFIKPFRNFQKLWKTKD
ncbi:nucleotidyltransferase domain-containing protein [Sulfurovum riftiae]|uniref:Nucleotidyltransferase n=1 Tax=Sulfurovum riftiae TaxID=1630136 RepID=A0A151CDH6_9BACT|nr:nucleotidyltransferase family protein [Sulfurovum riftiae]KYJ85571.1 hypothetical protein AS592_00570 [Sulfurovum riftiae]